MIVFCNPIADFNVNPACYDDQPIEFNNASSDGSAPINYWEWTITGGTYNPPYTNLDSNTQYNFTNCGNQSFTLLVKDTNNCEDSKPGNVNVWCEPIGDKNSLRNLRGIQIKA